MIETYEWIEGTHSAKTIDGALNDQRNKDEDSQD